MGISYKRPGPEEARDFAALHVQSWHEAYGSFLPKDLIATFSVEKRTETWRLMLAKPDRFVLGAYDHKKPVGFVNCGPASEQLIENQDGQLYAIYLLENYYRRGIGRTLFASAAADWHSRGGHSLTIGVLAENKRAISFYETMGAKLAKTGTYDWNGHKLPHHIYLLENLERFIPYASRG